MSTSAGVVARFSGRRLTVELDGGERGLAAIADDLAEASPEQGTSNAYLITPQLVRVAALGDLFGARSVFALGVTLGITSVLARWPRRSS